MATGATDVRPGGWIHIDIDDNVISLARFAVDEYNKKQHTHLEFKGVWTAKLQLVEGSRYALALDAADGGENNKYEAQVFVTLTNVKELEEFKPLLQAQA